MKSSNWGGKKSRIVPKKDSKALPRGTNKGEKKNESNRGMNWVMLGKKESALASSGGERKKNVSHDKQRKRGGTEVIDLGK